MKFELSSSFKPTGDQPQAIKKLSAGYGKNPMQTLLGITGSGKTFSMANIIQKVQKPTLILSHNKTLAAQLYSEFSSFFPKNRVEYFVSYFDYYQPESYLPTSDTYIEKDSKVNEKIEKLRLRATASLMSRKDVIIVSSVSCIYGIGSPDNFKNMSFEIKKGLNIDRLSILKKLISIQYERNDTELKPGNFRVRGDIIDVILGYEEDILRIELFGDEIETIKILDPLNMNEKENIDEITIYPARHFVVPQNIIQGAVDTITDELEETLPNLEMLEAHRLKQRTNHDIEMIQELGYCSGIENYSRHFDSRQAGQPPFTLLDFFPDDFLFFIDESHVTIPQLHGMYKGDYSRKKNLIDHGFRLPSAFDNRPLKFEESKKYFKNAIFVSATPGDWELGQSKNNVVKQIIRPTGLLDPEITVKKSEGQIDDLINEIQKTIEKNNRILVTTLTKKMAEYLSDYLAKAGIKVRYLHSEIDTLERTEIIRQLRLGEFDVLVGINLLREGIDIPEVELVTILDADKEGFLRNDKSLIQTIGRAARNSKGRVIMYADKMTDSMKRAIKITHDRRKKQIAYNEKNGITPQTIIKSVPEKKIDIKTTKHIPKSEIPNHLIELETQMKIAAESLEFEKAIQIRDVMNDLRKKQGEK
ncbi:excinuclease ABC subunit UvrB [archaeon]|jgi:excinuclease ABC subunit B|nr:excinuclease ABC subunit UvrB [archaeon]MBT6821276.1 excinuclease ABC subunit UvrB [archaeon]